MVALWHSRPQKSWYHSGHCHCPPPSSQDTLWQQECCASHTSPGSICSVQNLNTWNVHGESMLSLTTCRSPQWGLDDNPSCIAWLGQTWEGDKIHTCKGYSTTLSAFHLLWDTPPQCIQDQGWHSTCPCYRYSGYVCVSVVYCVSK